MGKRNSYRTSTDGEGTAVEGLDAATASYKSKAFDENDNDTDSTSKHSVHEGQATVDKKRVNIIQLYRFSTAADRFLIFIAVIFSIAFGATAQAPFPFIMHLINKFAELKNCTKYANNSDCNVDQVMADQVVFISSWFCLLTVGICVFVFIATTVFSVVADRVTRRVRQLAFTNILRQHIGYFDIHFGGELNTRLTQDVTKFEVGIGGKVAMVIGWVTIFFTGLILCLVNGWQLTLLMCALLPVAVIVGAVTARFMKIFSEKEMAAYAKAGGVAEEALTMIRVVVAYAGHKKEVKRYKDLLHDAWKVSLKSGIAASVGLGVPYLLTLGITAATVYFSGKLVTENKIDEGFVFLLFGCMLIGLRSLGFAAGAMEFVSDSQGAAYGLYEIIDAKTEIDSTSPDGDKLGELKGLIRFENVHFVYPARTNVPVLRGLTLDIHPGQSAALVGPSGCGKSTTIQLLQRFYDPLQGTVYLDGHSIKDLNIAWLRQQIGVVSQDPVLFATTIEDNIRFGKPDATFEEIEAAAREADAHHFIEKLPMKYNTLLNEQGTQLSRGEKQRISLARALVRKPKILLLDECTSALDNESEATVQAALDKASKGRTTIIIAHRLSTVKDADILFVVDKGVVAEAGTHSELLSKQGLYHQLVSIQMMEEKEKQAKNVAADDDEEILIQLAQANRKLTCASIISNRSNKSTTSSKSAKSDNTVFEQAEEEMNPMPKNAMRRIFAMNKEKWPFLFFGLIGGLLIGTTWPIFSILLSYIIEALVNSEDLMTQITKATCGIAALAGLACIITIFSVYLLRYFGESLGIKLRTMAYGAMLRQEIAWFDQPENQVGALTSRLVDETSKVKLACGTTLFNIAAAISSVICSVVVALTCSWQLGLVILPIMPLTIVAGATQGYLNSSYERRSHQRTEESGRVASEAVDKIRTLAALTKEFYFLDKYMQFFDVMKKEARKRGAILGFGWAFLYFCQFSAVLITFGFGFWLVSQELIEFPMIFRIFIVTIVTCADVGRANANVPEITASAAAASKLLQLLNRKPLINVEEKSGLKPESCSGEIALRDVSFCYPTRFDTVVLRKFNVAASRGQSVAIVGPSGSGKSTVVQLAERFYDVLAGVVTIDGHDIRELNINWLRSQIAIVLQDPLLFAVSVAENIAYGDNSRHITIEEVIDAAKAANIHSFVSTLPNGYETNVGSKGSQLSGGQKQRVSIARALIRNPKILLLDDATSALDSHSEAVVEEALEKARAGRTSVIIAHRLSSVVNANVILYMDRGRVLEKGTHAELMALKQHYYGLHQANLGNKS